MKVSVIIPVYNVEEYLSECLDTVFSQTLQDIEIICINDGSTDSSLKILKNYEKKFNNVVLIDIKNQGVGHARNLGLKLAKGKMCTFMDPDDMYPASDVLESMYKNIITHNVLICGGSTIMIKNGELLHEFTGSNVKYCFSEDKIMNYSEYQWSYGFWRFMYVREFLLENNIYFPLYSRYQDPPFFVNAMVTAKSFYAMKKATYVYRAGTKNIIYTFEKTRDCLLGMKDVLKLSSIYKLGELHRETLKHINTWLCKPIFNYLLSNDINIYQLLNLVRKEVNIDLLEEKEQPYVFEVERKIHQYKEREIKEKDFLETVNQYDKVIIYGAGYVGLKVGEYLKKYKEISKLYFAVTHNNNNDNDFLGIELKEITQFTESDKEKALVLIATMEKLHDEISNILLNLKFQNISKINYSEFEMFSKSFV